MGRQHVRGGILSIRQQKTGTLVEIPILTELQEALDVVPANQLTFLTTEYGQPFTAAGFGNWFRQRCNEAGISKGYALTGCARPPRRASPTSVAPIIRSWRGAAGKL